MAETTLQPPKPPKASKPPSARPPRPRRTFAGRLAYAMRSWAHETFSREQLINGLKSLAWVAPMTVLIWVYAEREQTATIGIEIHVKLKNADPNNRLVEIRDEGHTKPDVLVHADLSGPQARLELAKEKLEATGNVLLLDIDPNLKPGTYAIDLSAIGNDPLLVKYGLSLSNLVAETHGEAFVDAIVHRNVPVIVRPGVTNLDGPAVFKPETVQVSLPRSVSDKASPSQFVAYADLPDIKEPGLKSVSGVRVNVPISDLNVSFSPTTVSAEFTVKKSDVEDTIRSVPVWVLYPPSPLWDKYKPEYDKNIDDVKVTGPPDMIKEINDPAFEPKPKAIFDVTTADPPIQSGGNPAGTRHEATLKFDFGNTGLKISPNDSHKTISFTVVERKVPE